MGDAVFFRTRKERNYTVIDNTFLKDDRLSWRSKGIMTYLLSLPEDWKINMAELQSHGTEGRDAFRKAVNELEDLGYIRKWKTKSSTGKFTGTTYQIIENPMQPDPYPSEETVNGFSGDGKPGAEIPEYGKPQDGKPTDGKSGDILSTYEPSTNKPNTNLPSTNTPSTSRKRKDADKINYAEFVRMTHEEHDKLVDSYGPEATARMIEVLNLYKGSNGKTYKSDYMAILNWVVNRVQEEFTKSKKQFGGKMSFTDQMDVVGDWLGERA